jgi:hypothetical protein
LDQIIEHWSCSLPRGAKITVQQVIHIEDKLYVERLVEPHLGAQARNGVGRCGRAKHKHRRIAWDRLDQEEANQDDPE